MASGDAEQGAERGVPGAATVEAEDELVEIGLEMLAAQAVIDAQHLDLEVAITWAAQNQVVRVVHDGSGGHRGVPRILFYNGGGMGRM